jgi:hypothetical protein
VLKIAKCGLYDKQINIIKCHGPVIMLMVVNAQRVSIGGLVRSH